MILERLDRGREIDAIYDKGTCLKRDYSEARRLFEQAAATATR